MMVLENVRLANFRNYVRLEIEPAPGLNIFVGSNAQGKSNLLEAIAMLATGKSFRARREAELVRSGAVLAEIGGDARIAAGRVRLHCAIDRSSGGTHKTFDVNGAAVGFARFLGRARVVSFVPGDLALVAGGPALRRTFLNAALSQASPNYYRDLARYSKIIAQKSALLRGSIAPDRELLLAYNDEMAGPGRALISARAAFVADIAAAAADIYRRWETTRERVDIHYAPSVGAADLAAALAANVENELRRRQSLIGPHRDDVRLDLDGASLAAYGSQGQQRTAVLALKVAEYEVMRERAGDAPILLLDDVLSELDAQRAGRFLAALGTFEQAFLTTTELPAGFPRALTAFSIRDGGLTRLAC
jgi:DNA replication and repair protein RecF